MNNLEELLVLTRENNMMLKQLLLYIKLKESENYSQSLTIKEFVINVAANNIIR